MNLLIFIFILSLSVLAYCYFGYALLVSAVISSRQLFRRKRNLPKADLLPVTIIVTAYNEEAVIEKKIRNILSLDYPLPLLKVVFVTDGSADRSAELISRYPFITLLHEPERRGKAAAINRAMKQVTTPVVIFTDANALMNELAVQRMVYHYQDRQVGAVAGEKKISYQEHPTAVGQAEGMYWNYESFMKKLDAGFHSVVGAAGELFSIRTNLFNELNEDCILDDFMISMDVCLQGYLIRYEPGAFALEGPSLSLQEEEKRKTRIAAGALQAIAYLKNNPGFFKRPLLVFQFFSRRWLRWVCSPLMLVLLLLSNIIIVTLFPSSAFFNWFLLVQFAFYGMSLTGYFFIRSGRLAGIFTIPFYFLFMNYCLVKGFILFAQRKSTVLWEKSLRQAIE